jgi:hypothetical protein
MRDCHNNQPNRDKVTIIVLNDPAVRKSLNNGEKQGITISANRGPASHNTNKTAQQSTSATLTDAARPKIQIRLSPSSYHYDALPKVVC